MATLDPPLNLLRSQILACTSLEFGEIGWIAGASHRQEGAHFPEYPPPPGNPPYEVDAIDLPHDPSRGADMAVVTESLRLSCLTGRERRLRLVIFGGRQFSNYDHAEGPRYTWRKYYGSNQHTRHAHIERTDERRDDLHPWEIGLMTEDDRKMLRAIYSVFFVGGDLVSAGDPVPDVDRIPGTISVPGTTGVPRTKGNSFTEQLGSLRRLAALAAVSDGGGAGCDVVLTEADREAIAQRAAALVLEGLGALRFEPNPSV